MKVDIIYPSVRIMTGTRRYAEKLTAALQAKGVDIRRHPVRKIEFTLGGRPVGGLISQRFLVRFVRTDAFIVHALSPEVITERTNVVTVHDIIPLLRKDIFVKGWRDVLGYRMMFERIRNIHILVQTEMTRKQMIEEGFDAGLIYVTGGSVDSIFRPSGAPSPFPEDGLKHIVTVGDFNPRKRFDIIYRTILNMKGVSLYHIGSFNNWKGRYEELKSVASGSERIHLLGQQPDEVLVNYLTHADLFLYLSEEEGIGYTPAEAISCGCPALVNELPVFRETLGDAVYYTALDEHLVQEKIEELLSMNVDRSKLIEYAVRFSPATEAARVIQVYRKIESRKNPGP